MNIPTDSVRIVLFDERDGSRFLLVAEADDPDNWKLPGGKFNDKDEKPATAAARELKEELATGLEAVRLSEAGQLINDDGVSARYIFYGETGTDVQASEEIAKIQWVAEETIPDGKNKGHILSAVGLARATLSNR